ncbi:CBS domain-containing protein [Caenimonas terrae]|uniref:CBS domain-containing protein n=1 Tax=Caenimonas terrae TaxID=696074 RepID=A0ABW0N9Q5_9BURK
MTIVSQFMTRGVRTLAPSDTVMMAAQAMEHLDVGAIPVCDGDKLVGMVTDRDIVLRAVARSLDGSTKLSEVMSREVHCATEGQSVEQVLAAMAQAQIRRMPVVDDKRKLVGIVSLGDIAAKDSADKAGVAQSLGDISAQTAPDRKA